MARVKKMIAEAQADHAKVVEHGKEQAMEDLVVLRVKFNNVNKRNQRAGMPDDEATAKVEEASELLAKAEATEKRASMHTTVEYMVQLVQSVKIAEEAVNNAARAIKNRGAMERSEMLRVDRTSAIKQLTEAKRTFATMKVDGKSDDPTIESEMTAAREALAKAAALLRKVEEAPDSVHLNNEFVSFVPTAVAAVEQASSVCSRIKRLEELEGRVQASVDRLAVVKAQLESVIEESGKIGSERSRELMSEIDEAKSAMATADQAVEHCNTTLYSEENTDSLHQAVVFVELATQRARNLLDERASKHRSEEDSRLRASVETARKEVERMRTTIFAMHDADYGNNEADVMLIEVDKLAAFVPEDPTASVKAAERFVQAVNRLPEVIQRARVATAGARKAKADKEAAELAEARAEAEGCIMVFRSQLTGLQAKNKEMGSPFDAATQSVDFAQASVLMAEKLQRQADGSSSNPQIVQKFVDATRKARDAVEEAAELLNTRVEKLEKEREETLARERHTKLASDVSAAVTELSVMRHKLQGIKARASQLTDKTAQATVLSFEATAVGMHEVAHDMLKKHQANPDDATAAQQLVTYMTTLAKAVDEAEAAVAREESRATMAEKELVTADLHSQQHRLEQARANFQAVHDWNTRDAPAGGKHDDAEDAVQAARKMLQEAEVTGARVGAMTQVASLRDNVPVLKEAVDAVLAAIDDAKAALKLREERKQDEKAKQLSATVTESRHDHIQADTKLAMLAAELKQLDQHLKEAGMAGTRRKGSLLDKLKSAGKTAQKLTMTAPAHSALDVASKAQAKANLTFSALPADVASDENACQSYVAAVVSLSTAVTAAAAGVQEVHKAVRHKELIEQLHNKAKAIGKLKTVQAKLGKLQRTRSVAKLGDLDAQLDTAQGLVVSAQSMLAAAEANPEGIEFIQRLVEATDLADAAVNAAATKASNAQAARREASWISSAAKAKERTSAAMARLMEVDSRLRHKQSSGADIDPVLKGAVDQAHKLAKKVAAARGLALPDEEKLAQAYEDAQEALAAGVSDDEGGIDSDTDTDEDASDSERNPPIYSSADENEDKREEAAEREAVEAAKKQKASDDAKIAAAEAKMPSPPDTDGLTDEETKDMMDAHEVMIRQKREAILAEAAKRAAARKSDLEAKRAKRAEARKEREAGAAARALKRAEDVRAGKVKRRADRHAARAKRDASRATRMAELRRNADETDKALEEALCPQEEETLQRYLQVLPEFEAAVDHCIEEERSTLVGDQVALVTKSRRKLNDIQARNRASGAPDDDASKAIEAAVTAVEKAEKLIERVQSRRGGADPALLAAVSAEVKPLMALVDGAASALAERKAKEEELAKDTVLKDGLDALYEVEAKWTEATDKVKANGNLLVVPAVRAAYNEAREAVKQARMMRALVVEEDFTGVEGAVQGGAGGAGAGTAKVLPVPKKIRDQFVQNVQEANEAVTAANEAIALHDNRPEALHAAMSQQRLDAAGDLADAQRRLLDAKQKLRDLRDKHKNSTTISPDAKMMLGSATSAVAEAEASARTAKECLKRFDNRESTEDLLDFVAETVTTNALVVEAVHEVDECEECINNPNSKALELRAVRLGKKRNLIGLRQTKAPTVVAKLKANLDLLTHMVEGQEPGSAVAKAVNGARKAVQGALLAFEQFNTKLKEAGDPVPDAKLAGLAALAARSNMLATVAGSMVEAAALQEREGNPVTVELPQQASDAINRLDHARLKLDWLDVRSVAGMLDFTST